MILFYTASQDATIYLQQPYQNTGIDEMLELSKVYYGDTRDNSRALIQFDIDAIYNDLNSVLAKQNEISSSIFSSASFYSSSYNELSTSYNELSNSIYTDIVNLNLISASLFEQQTTTTTELATDYLLASQSVYVELVSVVSALNTQNTTLPILSSSYELVSASYATLLATETGSITDNVLSTSFNTISQSLVSVINESASLSIQSASLFNELVELNTLYNIVDTDTNSSASVFANQIISDLQAQYSSSLSNISTSLSTLEQINIDANIVSSSWNYYSNLSYDSGFTASLQLKITKAEEIPANFTIEAWAVSGSWEMGTGTRFDNITTNGVTWYYRNGDDTSTIWNNTYVVGQGASFNPFTTGSQSGLGGTWFTSSVSTQSFQYTLEDINLDVTEFVNNWINGGMENNGIIIKFPTDKENDSVDYGSIKMFSKETNTIYQPKLVISYLENDVVSGSLQTITNFINSSSYDVLYRCYSPNLKTSYQEGQKVTIKIDARELYPIKQFNSTFAYQVKYYLPENAFYTIIDTITKETIIPYSAASRVVRDKFNNVVKLDFSNWPIGRNYTMLVKSIDDHNEEIFEIGSFDIYK